ncbi:MAG: hypothetical protein Q7J25_10565 [Vicinamibacterales bacterium]|nr:hypothetical protein [Vicinamibacterales bacterium]
MSDHTAVRRWCSSVLAVALMADVAVRTQDLHPEIARDIVQTLAEGMPRELTRCKLQNAVWGGYDVRIHVTMGIDGLPYLFELREGRFSRSVDPQPMPGPARFERTGRVRADTAAEAFARGLPFFIGGAEVRGPNTLEVTLLSNPGVTVDAATLFVVVDQPGVEDLASVTIPVGSRPEPQRLIVTNDALSESVLVRIAILREVGPTALMLGCVLSNEVDLRPAL